MRPYWWVIWCAKSLPIPERTSLCVVSAVLPWVSRVPSPSPEQLHPEGRRGGYSTCIRRILFIRGCALGRRCRMAAELKYHRVLLKISGEALGPQGFGIDAATVRRIAGEVKRIHDLGIEV